MKNQKKYNKYRIHKVNVFNIHTFYRFFHISCDNCKLKEKCEPFQYKKNVCKVAADTKKLLERYTVGYVASFISDDFYIQSKKQKSNILPIFLKLLRKYATKTK